jgi:hypothetical protein
LAGEYDHFFGYFVFTLMFCLAWPRPLVAANNCAAILEELPREAKSDKASRAGG